jgi:hypothetical protein
MGRSQLALSALITLVLAGCGPGDTQQRANDILDEARETLAPDRRTVVFDVRAEATGRFVTLYGEVQDAELKERLLRFMSKTGEFEPVDSLHTLPDPSVGTTTIGIVSLSVANMRQKPKHTAEMATQAILGTPLRILKKEHGWLYVQTPDGYLSWTDDQIAEMTPDEYRRWIEGQRLIVTTEFGWVRSEASNSAVPVSDVVAGCILGLKGRSGSYWEVLYPDGRTGYLERSLAEPLPGWLQNTSATPSSIVATAKRFMGVPYLWGGTSAKGMDCSGFTKTVYFLNGIQLPRDASQQALVGTLVETDDAFTGVQPGDLLFFGFRANEKRRERVTHVGISLGGARFIHSSGDVHINSLNPEDEDFSPFRRKSFLRVKRMIGAPSGQGLELLTTIPYYRGDEN